jgi:hypothetical protein
MSSLLGVAVPSTLQLYFQQVRPLAKCDAEDGRVVGHMLVDLASRNPKDLACAIREFAYRTAMLRDCGFARIGDMLARLLSADVHGGSDDDTTAIPSPTVKTAAVASILAPSTHGESEHMPQQDAACDPASVTVEQAAAIGSMVARSVRSAHMPATALRKVVNKYAVLRTMKSSYVWFVPMLEVVTVHKAKQARRSTLGKRLSSIVAAEAPSLNVEADEADEESSFGSVVWLNAHTVTLAASTAFFPLFGLRAQQCRARHRRTGAGACGCPSERGRRPTAQRVPWLQHCK